MIEYRITEAMNEKRCVELGRVNERGVLLPFEIILTIRLLSGTQMQSGAIFLDFLDPEFSCFTLVCPIFTFLMNATALDPD